jgi:hypothetical protein
MRRVKTERFIKQLDTQGSVPCIFECSDGETYYVKHIGSNRMHVINELLGAKLLEHLGIPTPEVVLIEIVPDVIEGVRFERTTPEGLGFGSRKLDGLTRGLENFDLIKGAEIRKFPAPQALIGIVLFDLWVYNIDRTPRNSNVLLQEIEADHLRFVAIDHTLMFDDHPYEASRLEGLSRISLTLEDTLIGHPQFREVFDVTGLFASVEVGEYLGRIESTTVQELYELVNQVPVEWSLSDQEKEGIIKSFLLPRKDLVRGFFHQLLEDAKI